MKNPSKILMAALVAAAFTVVNRAQAGGEPLLSPRAKANQIHHVPGNTSTNDVADPVLVIHNQSGSPKSKEQSLPLLDALLIVSGPRDNRDTVRDMRDLNGSPKMKSQQALQSMSIAPLK